MSDRKNAHLQKLKQAYRVALENVERREGERLKKYKEKIVKDGCFHPESEVYDAQDVLRVGCGKWWTVFYKECRLCGEVLERRKEHDVY